MTAGQSDGSGLGGNSDQVLVLRAADGDRDAFAALLERHYDFIHRVACRWSGDAAMADDIAQEVCVRLGRAIRNFRGASAFTTWLYALTLNAARDHGRKARRDREKAEAWGTHQRLFGEAEEADPAEEQAQRLWQLVQRLSAKQRDAVLLVYGEGLSHAEAAAVMDCAEPTVSWHIHEAKKRLRQLMQAAEDE